MNQAYDGLGTHLRVDRERVEPDSIDGAGWRSTACTSVTHSTTLLGRPGDGLWRRRGQLFNRFSAGLDVVGHEFTHGVTQVQASLVYSGQSGALNQSITDVFGS